MSAAYDTVVGLEVHIQLNTQSKAFCGDALSFGAEPNTHVSAISLAHPGTLPVANTDQIEKAVKLGLALGCEINRVNFFDRKHYIYPDLPKGYQITQDNEPICIGGHLMINVDGKQKKVRIHHIHMEEDAGKTVHDLDDRYSLVDLNRAGTPLLELVTEPDLSSGEEVYQFITELQRIIRYIDVSDADMEKGSLRCDCNVSVKPAGSPVLGERCEIKNLNSRRFAREAVEYEAKRQVKMVERGVTFGMQTLHYDSDAQITQVMREKEGADDYRYIPDPDLTPIVLSEEYIQRLRDEQPPLPHEVTQRLLSEDKLIADHANQLAADPTHVALYDQLCTAGSQPRVASAFIVNQVLPSIDEDASHAQAVSAEQMIDYLQLINGGKVSASVAHQRLWPALVAAPQTAVETLASDLGILLSSDQSFLDDIIAEVISANPAQVKQYQSGKKNLLGFFVGAVMRSAKGKANPKDVNEKLMKALG